MGDKILLTGATGFLGTELAARLIHRPDTTVYALVRASGKEEARCRLRGAWHHDKDLFESIGDRVIPVPGDFTLPGLGLSSEDSQLISETATLVIHAGAEVGFQKSQAELERTNRTGTGNMLAFTGRIKQLRRFIYISTAYVAGRKKGLVMEDEPAAESFSSHYEKSKADAENLVRMSGLPFSICRPGMIVGDSKTGWIRNFNTVYYLLKLMLLGELRVIPVDPMTRLNLVPGDYVADSVIRISESDEAEGKTFHLTCPRSIAPSAEELTAYVRKWAADKLSLRLPAPVFVPLPLLGKAGLMHNSKAAGKKKSFTSNMLTLLPYFYGEQKFDRSNTDSICGSSVPEWHSYIGRLLEFACRCNFMRQSGRTVFEQARERRASRRYPVDYYDVTSDGIIKVSGPEANERISRIVDALWALGIRKGERVALTGINSVDYMTLEQAIGLLGAVSVPIYYTTPADETSLLLAKSGARWFFIGDRRMMKQLDEISTDAEIISFSAADSEAPASVMRWADFLSSASGRAEPQYPDPEDLATIRYTSGTTGEPKGVMFSYGQLAWMGEVLTNLLPWEDRNRSMRYLSFLPLSHVVEGILASYAPYYLLAKVDYYFLNDFGALTDALPEVRPNVFFSVPRFYEKVWDQVISNPLGKAWLAAEDGAAKKALGSALRGIVLRKAGIDRCRQLIVGSAPVSEALLLHFRELGIEIHNAYGQTEAPLITINRLGDNVIPTIGTPLPDTTVTAEDDGELIVTGPQVALGYYGLETDTIKDGVLRTGDLGIIHENGHITLRGRKKDFIITAYGKNISITKLEERLKDIPGVSEAVLIGENRPYCTALLWLEEGSGASGTHPGTHSETHPETHSETYKKIGRMIEQMNEGLSHPEQIRRFRIIDTPLSIRAGELTPNLKVKRANVEAHYADVIDGMYE